jgi:hypothetical protein
MTLCADRFRPPLPPQFPRLVPPRTLAHSWLQEPRSSLL